MHERTTDTTTTALPLPDPRGRSYTPGAGERGGAMTSADTGHLAGRPRVSREPLARAERLQITMLAGLFVLLAAMLSAGAVAFFTLSGHLLDLQEQVGSLRAEMHEENASLRAENASLRAEIAGLRVEVHEEMGELSERVTRVETLIETHLVPASNARGPAGP